MTRLKTAAEEREAYIKKQREEQAKAEELRRVEVRHCCLPSATSLASLPVQSICFLLRSLMACLPSSHFRCLVWYTLYLCARVRCGCSDTASGAPCVCLGWVALARRARPSPLPSRHGCAGVCTCSCVVCRARVVVYFCGQSEMKILDKAINVEREKRKQEYAAELLRQKIEADNARTKVTLPNPSLSWRDPARSPGACVPTCAM